MADQSTLSWLFKLDDRMSSPADKIASNLDRVVTGLEKTEKHTSKAEHQLEKLGRSAKNIERISVFEVMAKGAEMLLHVVERVVDGLLEAGKEIVKTAAENEQLEKSFALLLGPELGRDTLDYLDELSKHLDLTDDQAKAMGRSLLAVGFGVEELPTALAAITDMGAIFGGGVAGMNEAMSALERIKRTGHIDNRVLGGLGLSEKDVFGRLSANTGKTPEALKKLMESGKLDPNEALRAIYGSISAKTGKLLGAGGLEMGKTLSARLNKLKDLPGQFFQDLSHSAGFAKFSDMIQRVVDKLSPDSPTGKRLMAGLEKITDSFAEFLAGVDIDKAAAMLVEFLDDLPGYLRTAKLWFEDMVPALRAFWGALKLVGNVLGWVGDTLGEWYATVYLAVSTGIDRLAVLIEEGWARLTKLLDITDKLPHLRMAKAIAGYFGGVVAPEAEGGPGGAAPVMSSVLKGPMMGGTGSTRSVTNTVGDVYVNLPPGTPQDHAKQVGGAVHHTIADSMERAHMAGGA